MNTRTARRLWASDSRVVTLAGRGLGTLLGTWLVLAPHPAWASPAFPSTLRDEAAMDCTPACTICHTTEPGVRGTASQPFAISMSKAGLKAGNEDTVAVAYNALGDDVDSDEDGTPDKEELTAEGVSDPSAVGVGTPCAAEVLYGCGAHVAPEPKGAPGSPAWLTALFALVTGVLLWRVLSAPRARSAIRRPNN